MKLKKALLFFVNQIFFIYKVLSVLVWFFKIKNALKKSDNILLSEGGFGHSIIDPEMLRRMYVNMKNTCIVFQTPVHNPYVGLFWNDVDVFFFKSYIRVKFLSHESYIELRYGNYKLIVKIIKALLTFYCSARVMNYIDFSRECIKRLTFGTEADSFYRKNIVSTGFKSFYLLNLMESVPLQNPRLPKNVRENILSHILKYCNLSVRPKLCCIYLRAKGQATNDNTSTLRIGAELESFVPAITYLVKEDFVVLVTGDMSISKEYEACFNKKIISAEFLDVCPQLFSLFSHSESDIWIGNLGGGSWMPVLREIPMLVVDMYPYGSGLKDAWILLKPVYDETGNLVHYSRMFNDFLFDYNLKDNWRVLHNSPETLLVSIKEMLDSLKNNHVSETNTAYLKSFGNHLFLKYYNMKIPTVWYDLFAE
ncbi:MAG: TIGR04372 family glycosyltransferase [Nitrospirae bacterium]|nr:TIGR04372 family glycosyltransferase [Nitrospirota bacterium]MBF0519245.1 TIGR04372 family glycosyltransferase [Nitrospirota bacterium]MBF0535777.1 TIGR04372 family glycosyltransferase [Nitrospirota bacterium]MBF0617682.1 TIGR04372 family glycosyltransferase [Nitrospirota bacterium]